MYKFVSFFVLNRKRNNISVMSDDSLKSRSKLIPAERTFIIEKTDVNDHGNYSCELNGASKEIHVICKCRRKSNKSNDIF